MEEDFSSYSTQTSFFNGEFSLRKLVEEVKDLEREVIAKK